VSSFFNAKSSQPDASLALAVAASSLDGTPISPRGERIVNLTRLSPTIYPIIFAALASRFFKNLARWRLEARQGIGLAALEQIFGSQSLAAAVERLMFVRTHIGIGVLILLIWSLSPLGGQGAVRLLHMGEYVEQMPGTVFYAHPGYQESYYGTSLRGSARVGANTLYTSSLLASPAQRCSPTDLWGLPKIPQWLGREDSGERVIDQQTEEALAAGEAFYTSLLGVQVQGINIVPEKAQYNFTVQTLYYAVGCDSSTPQVDMLDLSTRLSIPLDDLKVMFDPMNGSDYSTFAAVMVSPAVPDTPVPLDRIPPSQLLYATMNRSMESLAQSFTVFDCNVRPVVVDTSIQCNSSAPSVGCRATHQRLVTGRYDSVNAAQFLSVTQHAGLRGTILGLWRKIEGRVHHYDSSATDKYLAGKRYPFDQAPDGLDWTDVPFDVFSGRLTTALNTYWEATLDPFNHTSVAFDRRPSAEELVPFASGGGMFSFNSTESTETVWHPVYRANRSWVVVLIITTVCLEILAVAGLVLEFFIRGPDILGFASSLTRENPYLRLSRQGSALDGPARARALGSLQVQLADVHPRDEVGYIALKAVSSTERGTRGGREWTSFTSGRLYL
jgi:hypothetical protein